MDWQPFNVNHNVRVRLTEAGRSALRKEHADLFSDWPADKRPEYSEPEADADGWSEFQLWDLMHRIGRACFMGGPVPFETTIRFAAPDATGPASQVGMSEANAPKEMCLPCSRGLRECDCFDAPIPAVQSGAVAWRHRRKNHVRARWVYGEAEGGAGLREHYEVQPLFAAPQSEPLPGGVGEADVRLIAVRDALLVAGGADPSNGVCRFSYWNLDKLNKAFDAALASLTIKGEAR